MMKILFLGALSAASMYFAQIYPVSSIPENLKKMLMLWSEKTLQQFRLIKLMK